MTTPSEQVFLINWGVHALLKLLRDHSFKTVLDIGCGIGEHKRFFELFEKKVVTCSLQPPADFVGDFLEAPIEGSFDVIWCSHVLEHQRNPGLFLDKVYGLLKEGGVLALCLPRHPQERLVSGHFTTWSVLLACQHLVHAGFDCRGISAFSTYEIGILVKKEKRLLKPFSVVQPWGVIKEYFPPETELGSEVGDAIINWGDFANYPLKRPGNLKSIEIRSKNLDRYPILRPSIHLID